MKRYTMICLVACLCFLCADTAFAQYSRAYANAPRGSHILQIPVVTSTSITDDEDALENRKTDSKIYVATYTYVFSGLKNRSSGISISLPVLDYFSYDKTTGTVLTDETGFGDITLLLDHNFFGGKSMKTEEFVKTTPGTYGGIHLALTLPTGDYRSLKSSNIGSNRLAFKTTYQHSLAFNDGTTWLEFYGAVKIFGDNDEYLLVNTLSQDALYSLEAYFSQDVSPTVWVEAGAIYANGGAISINGTEQVERQSTLQGVLGVKAPLWRKATFRVIYTPTLYDNRDNFVRGYSVRSLFLQTF